MQGRRGSIIYLLGAGDSFPEAAAREYSEHEVSLVGIRVDDRDAPRRVGEAVLAAFRSSSQLAGSIHGVGELVA
jgi:hypothetical protein